MNKVADLRSIQEKLLQIIGDSICLICYEDFNLKNKTPIMICMEQHNCCQDCTLFLEKCPMCRVDIDDRKFTKNRLMFSLLEEVQKIEELIKGQQEKEELELCENYGNDFEDYEEEKNENNCEKCRKVYLHHQKKKLANFQIRKIKSSILQKNKKNNDQNYLMLEA